MDRKGKARFFWKLVMKRIKKKIQTTDFKSILCPAIIGNFDKLLLSTPIPHFSDSCIDLFEMYEWITKKLKKKICKDPERLKKYIQLEKEFMDIYERAKVKEEKLEEEKVHFTQKPFYRFRCSEKDVQLLFDRFRIKRFNSRFSREYDHNLKY